MRQRTALGWVAAGAAVAAAIAAAAARRRREACRDPAGAAARVAALYDRGATRYDRAMDVVDRVLFAGGRRWVAGAASGDTLEVAAGSGRNLARYPSDVRLTLVDVSPAMIDLARRRAAILGLEIDARVGDAQALDFPGERFDTVVCTLGLCTIPDERRALQEAWRVLRPGGRLLLLEHVSSYDPLVRLGQRMLDPLFCLLAHDHLLRDPLPLVQNIGFLVDRVERHRLGIVEYLAARKPGERMQ